VVVRGEAFGSGQVRDGAGTTVRQRDFPQNASLSAANRVAPSETIYNDGTNNFIMVNPPIGNWSCR
jgi:hypothetical protein